MLLLAPLFRLSEQPIYAGFWVPPWCPPPPRCPH